MVLTSRAKPFRPIDQMRCDVVLFVAGPHKEELPWANKEIAPQPHLLPGHLVRQVVLSVMHTA